ncbi:MAG: four helix bundle protein [Drouetiella hepatica Uher 2000/2452]|jgi:four helix bundle protein|uniref:Four helix bundle protein n=1 Tax=Drouetiella hepatica Uher 2000/2452 TaxID=904376 RepID=A0A951Q7I5_9CYAN|nr:four helix bundle protein [Drouetiella hepatica Uher 2000/2452]
MGEYLIRQAVQRKSFEFALGIIRLYKKLQARQEFILSPQLLKCGTSIGVSVEEAIAEPSRETFGDRVAVASRSARETRYWLKLLQESKLVDVDVSSELAQIDELLDLLSRLV